MNSFCVLFFLLFTSGLALAEPLSEIEQGAYLVRIAGCADCHTAQSERPMAGGYRLVTEFGDFFTPNITPDQKTGIGNWSEDNFRQALRYGVAPNGQIYYPAFPYRSYSKISDEDMHKMYLYLRTLTPIENQNRPHHLKPPYNQRWLMFFWKFLFFRGEKSDVDENIKAGVGPFTADARHSEQWNRGAYLVEAFAHCAECHTPRNFLGNPKTSKWLAGNVESGQVIPNITPDIASGLGRWNKDDWLRFLSSGYTPQFKTPANEMAEVIKNTSALKREDREAMVEYLMSIAPVDNSFEAGKAGNQ